MLKSCRFVVAVAAVAMLGVLFAAGAEAKVVARAASGASFRIGLEGTLSGQSASTSGDMGPVANAWVKWVNAHGGINGHPVKVFIKDDADSASVALQNVETLVQQDHIQALVDVSEQDAAFESYITKSGVPVTGGNTSEATFTSSPDFFPTGGDEAPPVFYGSGVVAKARGDLKWGSLVCAEYPICADFFTPFGNVLKDVVGGGASQVYTGTIAGNAPNYTAQCLAAKQAGVQAVFIGDALGVAQRVIDNCAQQGIKFAYFVPSGLTPTLLKDPAASGLTAMGFVGSVYSNTPGAKLFNQIISKYAATTRGNAEWNDQDIEPFNGLQLFSLDATTNKLKPSSTPAKVKAGLYRLPSTTLGGLAPPLKFVKGKVNLVNCGFSAQIVNGKEKPHGLICVPKSKIGLFYKALGG